MKQKIIFVFSGFLLFSFSACVKESEEHILEDYIYCKDSLVSFSENIQPILNNDCVSCHAGTNPEGGVYLDSYAEVVNTANSGLLMDVINRVPGSIPMPQGQPKLNECKITTLQKWIEEGMLNN